MVYIFSTELFLAVMVLCSFCPYTEASKFNTILSFNDLLGSENLVPPHLDALPTRNSTIPTILTQLRETLSDSNTRSQIISNYLELYHQDRNGDVQIKEVFMENLLRIAEHNLEYDLGKHTYTQGVNHFTHLSEEEFTSMYLTGININNFTEESSVVTVPPSPLSKSLTFDVGQADAWDWRSKNAVTAVKDQQTCGSCVTFGTASIVESAMILWKGKPKSIDVSEQELVSCTTENNGCNGGWYDAALKYVQSNGLASEQTYPYKATNGICERATRSAREVNANVLKWFNQQPNNDEGKLKQGIKDYGPMGVAVAVAGQAWSAYKSGIFNGACESAVNHALVVVGWGVENGQNFFIVKNSWGNKWGEKGYMRLIRGYNKCLVASHGFATYA